MDQPEAGSSPQRSLCGCLRLRRRRPIKPEAQGRVEALSSSSTDSRSFKDPPPLGAAAEPVTLKPHLTGRRSRSDSPKSEGGADEQPVKRQNSMGHDDPAIGLPGGLQPMEEAATLSSSGAQLPGSPRSAQQGQQQQGQQQQQDAAAGGSGGATVANACPPFGSKSVIGRRAKMEDACVAVPFLVEVPVSRGGMDELLPPRIAPQLRSSSGNSAASDQTGMGAVAPAASNSAGSAPGGGAGSSSSPAVARQGGQPQPEASNNTAMSLDTAAAAAQLHSQTSTETLHFFGVFDGHGGADAALHCARSLHERVREVLSACSTGLPGSDLLALRHREQEGAAAAAAPQASSSSDSGGQQAAGSSASPADDAPSSRQHHAGSATTDYQDAAGDLQSSGSGSGSSYLDADFEGGGEPSTANSVQGMQCTAETIEAALTKAFHITDEEFGNMGGYEHLALVGTTAVVALVGSRMIYVANCGDSRAVLCRSGGALPLTDDHKAAREDETARVEAAGGQILFWNGVRVMGLLAVSRAIGDHSLRPYVIAEPEVTIIARHPSDEVLVMASDGLWDVMSNQEAVTLAKKCLGRARSRGSSRQSAARVAATVLARAAMDRGSRDNVTVVIVDLSPLTAAELEAEAALSERSETVTVPDERAASGMQRKRSIQPSFVAVRSSGPHSGPPGTAPPPVSPSPFAAQALQPLASPFTDPPPPPAAAAAAPEAPPTAASAAGPAAAEGGGGGGGGGALPPVTALVSPFSSGALPAGLDFDVHQHASAVAVAAAAAAAAAAPAGQQQQQQHSEAGGGGTSGSA